MDDLIKRQDFDKFLEDAEKEATKNRKYVFASALNTIRGNLRNFPSAQPEQQWIPVSERPPEDDGKYLVTAKPTYNHEKQIELAYWQFGKWSGFNQSEILAWQHPPKPYKGEE